MPELELLEVDGCLLTLALLELSAVAESRAQKREVDGGGALRAAVDESVDGLAVIGEVWREGGVGEVGVVICDQVAVVGRDLLGLGIGQAVAIALFGRWARKGTESEERSDGERAEGRHCCLCYCFE